MSIFTKHYGEHESTHKFHFFQIQTQSGGHHLVTQCVDVCTALCEDNLAATNLKQPLL